MGYPSCIALKNIKIHEIKNLWPTKYQPGNAFLFSNPAFHNPGNLLFHLSNVKRSRIKKRLEDGESLS